MISTTYPCLHLERFDRFPLCFPILFAIGSRRRGGALQLGDRGHRELCDPAEVMRVKDSLNVLERVPRDGRDFGYLVPGLCQACHGRPAYIVERKVVRCVRLRACLAPTRAEAV